MLHLTKLAVGVTDAAHLRELQQARAAKAPPLRHLTRSFPRRSAEVIDGGSIYWVIRGAMVVRQRVLDIAQARREDGTPCTALMLDPVLAPVDARLVKPFQGWRYLAAADAPGDYDPAKGDAEELPEALRSKLRELCLI